MIAWDRLKVHGSTSYEADLIRTQYMAVDPANRLVALELERNWNLELKSLEKLNSVIMKKSAEMPFRIKSPFPIPLGTFPNILIR